VITVTDQKMTSTRPYLVRALYEWIIDNQCTPYLLVNALDPGTRVPQEYVKDGQIILNLAPGAIRGLVMDNERIEFSARFGGVARSLHVPLTAVMAIYAKENGKGMFFDPNEEVAPPRPAAIRPAPVPAISSSAGQSPASGASPVKSVPVSGEAPPATVVPAAVVATATKASSPAASTAKSVKPVDGGASGPAPDGGPGSGGGKPGKGKSSKRPSLKVVK